MHPRRMLTLPAIAGLTIILADRLLWDASLGLGASLMALAVGSCLIARGTPDPAAWAAVGISAILLVVDPGLLAAMLALLLLSAAALRARGWYASGPAAAVGAIIAAVLRALPRLPHDARVCRRLRTGRPSLASWILPLLGATVFLVLFGLGNPLIGRWWGAFGDWLSSIGLPTPGRIAMWWTTLVVVWAMARIRGRLTPVIAEAVVREPDPDWTVRCLICFNAVFVLQNTCDVVYLWGGAGLPDGLTFAAYAHRGAYPLVATALLAGAFVMICVRPGGLTERSPLARWLVLGFLAQTVILAVSSWWRLDLYVEAYGLSRWRLAALIWMGLVALGLLLIAVRIGGLRSSRWLIEANAWTLSGALLLTALGDADGLIARHNVERSLAAEATFDLGYTASLGPAALPSLERYVAVYRDPDAIREVARLRSELKEGLADWRAWTCRRWLIRHTLAHFP